MARKKKENGDESNENIENRNDSDDTFGLPDIEYKPLNREEETTSSSSTETPETPQPEPTYEYQQKPVEQQNTDYTYDPEEEEGSSWPKVLGIIIVLVLALGAGYYWWWMPRQAEKERLEAERKEKERKDKEAADLLAEQQRLRDEAEKRRADSLANIPKVGSIETLSERTGRYYVVIASAVDDDLLMDYAKKLSTNAVSSKIIPPFAKYKLFRLTIADADTFASAQEMANTRKAEYGDALWVLKY